MRIILIEPWYETQFRSAILQTLLVVYFKAAYRSTSQHLFGALALIWPTPDQFKRMCHADFADGL